MLTNIEERKIINQISRGLRIVISNLSLYSPQSQIVKDGILQLHLTLSEYFNKSFSLNDKLVIGESDRTILVNGEVIKDIDKGSSAFVENMISNNLKSITFLKGITQEEIFTLLENISVKKKEKKEDLEKILKEKGFTHLEINKKVYVAVGEEGEFKKEEDKGAKLESSSQVKEEKDEKSSPKIQEIKINKVESLTEEARNVVKGSSQELVHEDKRKDLQRMLKELNGINRVDLAGEVVDKMAENLDDFKIEIRLQTVRSFKQLNPTIQSLNDKNIIDRLENKFISTEEKETEKTVYNELADLLEESANRNINEGNYEKSLRIIQMFKLHKYSKGEGFEGRSQCAEDMMQRLVNSGLLSVIISDLRSSDKRKQEDAYKVVLSLEEHAVFYLISTLKEIEDLHLRRILAFVIKNLGESAVKLLVTSITDTLSSDEAKKIIEVLDSVEHHDIISKELKNMYTHYSPEIRREVLKAIVKISPLNAVDLLGQGLDDYDLNVIKEAIRLTGKIKCEEAVPKLLTFISPQSLFSKNKIDVSLQEETCIALGKIKNKSTISILQEVAKGGNIIKFKKDKPVSIKITALYGLANFKQEDTRHILMRFLNDKDINIVKAAKEALRKQETAISEEAEEAAERLL
ncbi:MAG: HEAT repeat domain-containing protein [Candidatus Firestonebacteria bacterium]